MLFSHLTFLRLHGKGRAFSHGARQTSELRVFLFISCVITYPGKEDGKTCKRVAIRTTIRKDDCRSNAPVRPRFTQFRCGVETIATVSPGFTHTLVKITLFTSIVVSSVDILTRAQDKGL